MCPFCQSPNPQGATTCRTCGSPLKGLASAPASTSPPPSNKSAGSSQAKPPQIARDDASAAYMSTHVGDKGDTNREVGTAPLRMSTHVADNAPRAMPQATRSPSDIAARAALFSDSTSPSSQSSLPVLQAALLDPERPVAAIAFWPHQNRATNRNAAHNANVKSKAPLSLALCDEDGALRLWNTHGSIRPLLVSRRSHHALCVALSPKHRIVATGHEDGIIRLRSAPLSQREKSSRRASRVGQEVFKGHHGAVRALAWSDNESIPADGAVPGNAVPGNAIPGSAVLASGGADGVVRLWDAHNPRRRQIVAEGEHGITALAWSRDGNWLAWGDDGGAISVWDARNGHLINHHIKGGGVQKASAYSGERQSGDIRFGSRAWTKTKHDFWIGALCFSPNNRALASGGYDGTTRIWAADSGWELQVLAGSGGISSAAFAPDNRTLCCGKSDGALQLWDSWTGAVLHDLLRLSASVRALAFAPRPSDIGAASDDSNTAVLEDDIPPVEILAAATSREVCVWQWQGAI